MISKIREFFTFERETPASLFIVRNIIEGENEIQIPAVPSENFVSEEKTELDRILGVIAASLEPLSSSQILNECISKNICSRATFFRKLKDLVKGGMVKKVRKGKNCFYTIA